ncbi:TPA: hypothetical protein DEP21_06275 [Patescibacteria group bacterium]|nr:hypothetical protein [Candidatus Gracilibacteria bacterium]
MRKYKSEQQISMGAELESITITCTLQDQEIIKDYLDDLKGVTKAKEISFQEGNEINITITPITQQDK